MLSVRFRRGAQPRLSFSVCVAATVAGLLAVSALVVPTTASAATVPVISLVSEPGHPEILVATVTSDSAVTSVSAVVFASFTEVAVAFTKDATGDTWTSEPIVLEPLGWAWATVSATDADGDSATLPDFRVDYLLQPVLVDHAVDIGPMTYTHRSVSVTGHISFYDPRTRTTGPLPEGEKGGFVDMYLQGGDYTSARVSGDGAFSLTSTLRSDASFSSVLVDLNLTASYWPEGQVAEGFQDGRPTTFVHSIVRAVIGPARVVFDVASRRVKRGQGATLRGVVQRRVGGTWRAVPGQTVLIGDQGATAVTGADGRFATVVEPTKSVAIHATLDDPFLRTGSGGYPQDSVQVWVSQKAKLTWVSRSIDADSYLHVRATLLPSPDDGSSKAGTVYLQDSRNGATGWRSLYALKSDVSGRISANKWVPHPSWKYRLAYKGNHLMQPTISAVIPTSRRDTRIIKANLSPSTVRKGRATTISGVVQKDNGAKFVGVGNHQKVYVLFKAKGSSTYTVKATTYTSSSGKFSKSVTATKDGYWAAVWLTSGSTYVHASTADLYVNVTGTSAAADALPVPVGPNGPASGSVDERERREALLAAID